MKKLHNFIVVLAFVLAFIIGIIGFVMVLLWLPWILLGAAILLAFGALTLLAYTVASCNGLLK
jgi:hypothetical protein